MTENFRQTVQTWSWVISLLGNIVVALLVLAGREWVENSMTRRLEHYVSRQEFLTWQSAHEKWGEQVIRNQALQLEPVNQRLGRIELKLDRISREP